LLGQGTNLFVIEGGIDIDAIVFFRIKEGEQNGIGRGQIVKSSASKEFLLHAHEFGFFPVIEE
jgi:hypothetical protein